MPTRPRCHDVSPDSAEYVAAWARDLVDAVGKREARLALAGYQAIAANIACLDYSVARDGHLCAYRWSGEQSLSPANFVTVAG
jgi:hexokinase